MIHLNNETDLKQTLGLSFNDIWNEFMWFDGWTFKILRCVSVTMHKHIQKILKGQNEAYNMIIVMNVDNSIFGQIMLEFKEKGQFHINSNPDLKTSKFITLPKDAE